MQAEVVAVGPFRADLVPLLSLPADRYARVAEGALIFERVVPPAVGNHSSTDLAHAVGAEPWDLNTHALDLARIDWAAVRAAVAWYAPEAADAVLARFRALAGAGFRFWFRPNG